MNLRETRTLKYSHQEIHEYCLSNDRIKVTLLSYGAALTGIHYLGDEHPDILLSYSDLETYISNPIYSGAVLGPTAGRIKNAVICISEHSYLLSNNDGNHNSHGGYQSLSFQNASLSHSALTMDYAEITFDMFLGDGQDGFPGNRSIKITYRLTKDNQLYIYFSAVSDKDTYLNLSSHPYFNLLGDFRKSILDHEMYLDADIYIGNDSEHIPAWKASVTGTPFDYKNRKTIRSMISRYKTDEQLHIGNGYNNAFVLNHQQISRPAAMLRDPISGRLIIMYTDAPAMVLYSGGYIPDNYRINNGCMSRKHCAIALEPQDIPDIDSLVYAPVNYLGAGDLYERVISYAFC